MEAGADPWGRAQGMNTPLITSHIPLPGRTEAVSPTACSNLPISSKCCMGTLHLGTLGISFPQRTTSKVLFSWFLPSPFPRTCKELRVGRLSENVPWKDDWCKCWGQGFLRTEPRVSWVLDKHSATEKCTPATSSARVYLT